MKIAVILINGFPHTPDEGIHIAYPLRIAYLPKYNIIDVYNINMEKITSLLVYKTKIQISITSTSKQTK